jgi:hypothetical protein
VQAAIALEPIQRGYSFAALGVDHCDLQTIIAGIMCHKVLDRCVGLSLSTERLVHHRACHPHIAALFGTGYRDDVGKIVASYQD